MNGRSGAVALQRKHAGTLSIGRIIFNNFRRAHSCQFVRSQYVVFGKFVITVTGDQHGTFADKIADSLQRRTHE